MIAVLSDLKHPIIQAPMAGVQGVRLAAAVCRAGALGSLPAAMLSAEQLADSLTALHAESGGAPYNVNFFAHRTPAVSAEQQAAWLSLLQPYFDELGINPADIAQNSGRQPFDEAALQVVETYRPAVISFHFGLPEPKLLQAVKATGAQVWSSATTVAEARWLAAHGADAVIAQGWEAGGHRGWFLNHDAARQTGTFALLPQVAGAVDIPVIAAGGISDAAGVRAAMTLGAAAVQAGTAFLLADEADTRPAHRVALQSPRAEATVVTNLLSGGMARGIPNRLIDEIGAVHPAALPFPLAGAAVGLLKAVAEAKDSDDFSTFWAGQNAPLARAGSAAQIVARLAAGLT